MAASTQLACIQPENAPQRVNIMQVVEKARALQRKAALVADVQLPAGAEYHYHHSTSSQYASTIAALQQQTQGLLAACQGALGQSSQTADPVRCSNCNELQEWTAAVLDELTSAVDMALDRHKQGEVQQIITGSSTRGTTGGIVKGTNKARGFHQEQAPALAKPQEKFTHSVDNSNAPFVHWAQHLEALGAQRPLANTGAASTTQASPSSGTHVAQHASETGAGAAHAADQAVPYDHPFRLQLQALMYPAWQTAPSEPVAPRAMSDTPLHWVDTSDALNKMVAAISQCSHIAIDLEHHDFRSFQGFTCLMQVSSRDTDWVVDTLALRDHLGPALAAVLANPAIVKVLHGSDRDVLWCQRDFHLYIINMFDTGQAARVLSLPSASLAYLLEQYCSVAADKRYQLADWRVRPLSQEMIDYARGDTHYLLYIHDRLKQQLHQLADRVPPSLLVDLPGSLAALTTSHCAPVPDTPDAPAVSLALAVVLEQSRRITARLYRKEVCTPATAEELLLKWQVVLAPVQRAVFTALLLWRDKVCREEDEGTGYVLPRAQLLMLAKNMPGNVKDMLRQAGSASEPLKRRAAEVVACMQQAKSNVLGEQATTASPTIAPTTGAAAAATSSDPDIQPRGKGVPNSSSVQEVAQLQPAVVSKIHCKGALLPSQASAAVQTPAELSVMGSKDAAAGAGIQAGQGTTVGNLTVVAAMSGAANVATAMLPAAAVAMPRRPLAKKGSAFAAALSQPMAAAVAPDTAPNTLTATSQTINTNAVAAVLVTQQLRASFVLPFSTAPQQAQHVVVQAPQQAQNVAGQAPVGDDIAGADGEQDTAFKPLVRRSGSDIRTLVDQLQATGPQDISLDADGQAIAATGSVQQDMEQDEMQAEAEDGYVGMPNGHDGQEVGLPELEFVPMSLKEMKHKPRSKPKSRSHVVSSKQQPAVKRPRYTTGVAADAAADTKAAEQAMNKLFDEDEEDSSDSDVGDDEPVVQAQPAEPQLVQVFRDARKRAHQQTGRDAAAGRGRGSGGGPERGRASAARGSGKRGERTPAFNPYHIPDEHLVKAGKRTTVMPRSGSRTATFKK